MSNDFVLRPNKRLPMFGSAPEVPALLGLAPSEGKRKGLHIPEPDELSKTAFELISAVQRALLDPAHAGAVFPLDGLGARDRETLWDMLGEGEVSIVVQGASRYEIDETGLAGVFRVRTRREDGDSLHLEVGKVPAVVVAAAQQGTTPTLPVADPPPPGLMNAQPLVLELAHRMTSQLLNEPNHVVSLTLLPLNDADVAYLAQVLGAGPVQAESRGYGTCRVHATARRGIWAVQHFNAMDALILDTLEVGGVPSAIVADPMDLEDSGNRLAELLELARSA
jgi:hydrogenase-1 operon protein HyaF